MVEATNIVKPTMLGSREISGQVLIKSAAISKITAECFKDSSTDSRTAFLETKGFVVVFANRGTTDECKTQYEAR